jgi:hypothetical protein
MYEVLREMGEDTFTDPVAAAKWCDARAEMFDAVAAKDPWLHDTALDAAKACRTASARLRAGGDR